MNFSPFLASISLVFPRSQARSAGGRAAHAAGVPSGSCSFLLPPSFLPSPPRILFSHGPSGDQEWVPSDGPLPDVSSCLLVAAARPPAHVSQAAGAAQGHPPPHHGAPHGPLCPNPTNLRPQTLTANKTPEARAVVISEITL